MSPAFSRYLASRQILRPYPLDEPIFIAIMQKAQASGQLAIFFDPRRLRSNLRHGLTGTRSLSATLVNH